MQNSVTAHITKRGPNWLVRITAPSLPRPIWRKYHCETHTEAEAVIRAARHVAWAFRITWQPSLWYTPKERIAPSASSPVW